MRKLPGSRKLDFVANVFWLQIQVQYVLQNQLFYCVFKCRIPADIVWLYHDVMPLFSNINFV